VYGMASAASSTGIVGWSRENEASIGVESSVGSSVPSSGSADSSPSPGSAAFSSPPGSVDSSPSPGSVGVPSSPGSASSPGSVGGSSVPGVSASPFPAACTTVASAAELSSASATGAHSSDGESQGECCRHCQPFHDGPSRVLAGCRFQLWLGPYAGNRARTTLVHLGHDRSDRGVLPNVYHFAILFAHPNSGAPTWSHYALRSHLHGDFDSGSDIRTADRSEQCHKWVDFGIFD
jgi:hypothetical protein